MFLPERALKSYFQWCSLSFFHCTQKTAAGNELKSKFKHTSCSVLHAFEDSVCLQREMHGFNVLADSKSIPEVAYTHPTPPPDTVQNTFLLVSITHPFAPRPQKMANNLRPTHSTMRSLSSEMWHTYATQNFCLNKFLLWKRQKVLLRNT